MIKTPEIALSIELPPSSAVSPLLPIMALLFVAYLVIGLAMPVLPLQVHQGLGLGTFSVGLVAGSQFGAALLSRMWAGHFSDRQGPRRAVVIGLLLAAAAGVFYLLSLRFVRQPEMSAMVLLIGRAFIGVGESFIITGSLSWGLALMGPQNTGTVMSWLGTALYAAFAVGAPVGSTLFAGHGFTAIGIATLLIPIGALALVALPQRVAAAAPQARPALRRVVAVVWAPGLGLALSGVGFGAITTFIVLLFAVRGWSPAWLPFTAMSIAFILGRAVFGHLPDKIGGARVALICILIEATGQALIWLAPTSALALIGVVLSGLGYSLVYPGLGVEAIRRAPPENRALAMGAYTACLDLSLGLTGPMLGLVASKAGIDGAFFASTLAVLCSAGIAVCLLCATSLRKDPS
jgi:MFS family permease